MTAISIVPFHYHTRFHTYILPRADQTSTATYVCDVQVVGGGPSGVEFAVYAYLSILLSAHLSTYHHVSIVVLVW